MEYIDLSYPIRKHWRWIFQKTYLRDYTMGDPLREEVLFLAVHCFTHIDPPGHVDQTREMISDIPLAQLIGKAKVFDLSHVEENSVIAAENLEKCDLFIEEGDMVLIKTCHGLRYTLDQQEFWLKSPYMTESAASWLVNKKVKAVGFDFPQDYVLRDFFSNKIPAIDAMVMHNTLLKNGILQIEYLTNLDKITESEIMLYAIPLNLDGIAGSPARVFAVRD